MIRHINTIWIALLCTSFYLPSHAQHDRTRTLEVVSARPRVSSSHRISTQSSKRKIMLHRKDKVWVLGQNNIRGHWSRPHSNEIKSFKKKKNLYPYEVTFNNFKPYDTNSNESVRRTISAAGVRLRRKIPKKVFNIHAIEEDWSRIHTGKRARNLNGFRGKTNVYYFKNIGKNELTTFSSVHDHIIVTDTLYGPASFLNTDGKPRSEKRSYIKIIANCIVYESPIRPASTRSKTTDYVFSAKKIIFKTPFKGLSKDELRPSPPFVAADSNIKIHMDSFGNNERMLANRLYIEIMEQLATELRVKESWAKDKLLVEFQEYRGKVDIAALVLDKKYRELFNRVCSEFDSDYRDYALGNERVVDGHTILVRGSLSELPKTSFKYYSLPTNSTVMPTVNQSTGIRDMLGTIFYRATGDDKLDIAVVIKLGHDINKFKKIGKTLIKKGVHLEEWPPNSLMRIEQQPLLINGKTIGKVIPINNQILRLEISIPDNTMAINELFPKNTRSSFELVCTIDPGQKKFRETIAIELPKNLLDRLRPDQVTKMFNIVESNTLADRVKVSSHLLPMSEDMGALDYIQIVLVFSFDNQKKVFRGPFNLSSNSTFASELEIPFIKHSENYQVSVSGKAFYEFGERKIKEDFIPSSKFIQLEEGILSENEQ
nr:hypothetical protein [Allomuricauda sp.]